MGIGILEWLRVMYVLQKYKVKKTVDRIQGTAVKGC